MDRAWLDFRASQSLALGGIVADIRRSVQVARKKQGLEVDQHMMLVIHGDQYVRAAVKTNDLSDVLADHISVEAGDSGFSIDGVSYPLTVSPQRCSLREGEIYFDGDGEYESYWDAVEAWAKDVYPSRRSII